jgi:hypothetical protein
MQLMVVNWEEALAGAAGMVTAVGVIAGGAWYIFGPRVREALRNFFHTQLEPTNSKIDNMDERNTAQHMERAETDDQFRQDVAGRWERHEALHRDIATDVGEIKGMVQRPGDIR